MKLKCGFEWHIQLDTSKLFCRCIPYMHEEEGEIRLKRLFKPSFGESGKVDISAEFEGKKTREIVYNVYRDSDCLVDVDEEPPHQVDSKALEISLGLSNALGSKVLENIMFMRKTIVDGSNTSGFQRTAIVGLGGEFDFKGKKISISTVSLEEDSARKESETGSSTTYKLDRLGIPLIEVATGIIETDENEAKEIALAFGRFTRLFKVRRGLGTIRQDVNLSIEGGSRVELKGFQNIREMDKAILNEAKRQASLVSLIKEKGYLKENLKDSESKDISSLFADTGSNIIRKALSDGKKVTGINLSGFKGVLGTQISEGKRFGTEVSDYLKIKSGNGIIHSDELPNYGITDSDVQKICEALSCRSGDAFVLCIHEKGEEKMVFEQITDRIGSLLTSVPSEVRLVKDDNSTSFLRPLGGKNRMYIETDLPILKVDQSVLKKATKYKNLSVESIKEKYGLSEEYLEQLINANKLDEATEARAKFKLNFNVIISVMIEDVNYIRHRFRVDISEKTVDEILSCISSEKIAREASRKIMEAIALNRADNVNQAIEKLKLRKISRKALQDAVIKLIKENKIERYDTLITNLRDRLGFSFDVKDAYEIASKMIKNG